MGITILLVDDHKIVFESLQSLLDEQPDMRVVGWAEDGRDAVAKVKELEPALVIMDVAMPGLNGIEATQQIRSHYPGTKIIALSMHTEKQFVTGILNAGASGYLTKNCSSDELVSAIRSVAADKKYLSPDIAGVVIEESLNHSRKTIPSASSILTMREREVLQLIVEGNTVKQIAERLYLSIKTIHTHRNQIMQKLNMHSTAELTKFAIREGMIPLQD
jgi:DNA-binding NarL/FixJ family response regulator